MQDHCSRWAVVRCFRLLPGRAWWGLLGLVLWWCGGPGAATGLASGEQAARTASNRASERAAFRFAFVSDTHVGSTTGAEDLAATVRDINSITGLSFVVISGDITEYGSLAQLELARRLLKGLKLPCHLIPGNHDTKWSESGATDFPRLWKQDHFVFEQDGLRFIGMHEGPVMKMGDGDWAPQDVRWLKETLAAMPDPDQPVVFVTHYPIDDSIANWYAVLDLLKQYNVQVVLCGHGHANRRLDFEGVPGVMGRSNLRANKPVGGYNLVEVRAGRMTFCQRIPGRETRPAWTSVVLTQHDFASTTRAYPRPDFSVNQRFPNIRERWSMRTGYTIASTPVVWENLAIVGDASGAVVAYRLDDGAPQWRFQTHGPVYSTPAVSGARVVFASCDGGIDCLNAADGKQVWHFGTRRPIVASPVIADGRVFIGSSERKFRALDLVHGKLVWEFKKLKGFVETRPLIADRKVIFGAWDEYLYALDEGTGKLLWTWKGDKSGTLYSPAACWPVLAMGKVFIVAPDRKMTALAAADGEQIWRTGAYMVRESLGLSEDQNRVYVRTMDGYFDALSTQEEKPELLWTSNGGFGYDINSAMLVEKDGTVFYGTKNGLLFALDGKTGACEWQHRFGVGTLNTVVALSGTEVLATDINGKLGVVENR